MWAFGSVRRDHAIHYVLEIMPISDIIYTYIGVS